VATLQSVTGVLSIGLFLKHFKSRGGLAYKALACHYNRHIVCKFKLRCMSEMTDFCIIKSLGHLDTKYMSKSVDKEMLPEM